MQRKFMKYIIKIIILSFIINSTKILANDSSFNINQVQAELQARFANAEYVNPVNPVMHNLAQFYRSRAYMPVWVGEEGISVAAQHALATFANAGEEGLDPNDYMQALYAIDDAENYPERAVDAELIMTKTALQYIDDVNGKRLNPQKITDELYAKKVVSATPIIFAEHMSADPSGAWLESYTFNNPYYQSLKNLLAQYRQILHELPNEDPEVTKKIQQIIINMERWRWLPEKMPERYAMVNIATFELNCIENDRIILTMPVVIGTNYRKTPVFASTVDSVRFNPSWYLPRNIAIEDSLPKIKANTGYIDQRQYVLYNSAGRAISPYSVNWTSVNANNFNFHLRQIPGEHNALGKIRFGLTNSNGIYLHDTSNKEHFEEAVRTYSSGCIRLMYPDEFALFVFNDPQTWPLDRIRDNMEGTLTKNIPLDQTLPIYVAYFTVWEDEAGQMHFADDVYDKDQKLIEVLKYSPDGRYHESTEQSMWNDINQE